MDNFTNLTNADLMFFDLVKNKEDLDKYIQDAIENKQWIADIWLDRPFDGTIDFQHDNYDLIRADKITENTIEYRSWNLMAKYICEDNREIFIDMHKTRMLVAMNMIEAWNFVPSHNIGSAISEEVKSRYMHDFYCVWEMSTDNRYYFKSIEQAEAFHHFLIQEGSVAAPHIFGQNFYKNELTAIQHYKIFRKASVGFFHEPVRDEVFLYLVKDMYGEIVAHFLKESDALEFVRYLKNKRDKMDNKDNLVDITYIKVPLSSSVNETIKFYEKKEAITNDR